MAYLAIIVVYSLAQIALGVWVGAAGARQSSDFFVAGRSLGPGLLFATFLAANIGAGSTIGATGLGYRDGLARRVVGRLGGTRVARSSRSGSDRASAGSPRSTISGPSATSSNGATTAACAPRSRRCSGSARSAILAGQLIGIAWILTVVIGIPKIAGCALGALVVTVVFRRRRPASRPPSSTWSS